MYPQAVEEDEFVSRATVSIGYLGDNCSADRSQIVKDPHEAAGVLLRYLPPCSPDLSPVEPPFSVLETWIKKSRKLTMPFVPLRSLELFLDVAVQAANIGDRARELFRYRRYNVEDEDIDVGYSTM